MAHTKAFITGGAGFIGSNLAYRLLSQNTDVVIYDNLSRGGAPRNLKWLHTHPAADRLTFIEGDLRDFDTLKQAVQGVDHLFHLAGQVAVTSSVIDPRKDFEDNALGTFNVLEAARQSDHPPIVLYSSTNKVYGGMEEVEVVEEPSRYAYRDLPFGVPETQPLDFHSPYGCSKGAGDQYVRDYARIYGLKTVVMRQSCIYGYRQFGVEDQGWLAWFMIAVRAGKPITIFGDGKQVRDVLFIEDLLDAYAAAIAHIDTSAGQVYNIGGGPDNTVSIWREFGTYLSEIHGTEIPVTLGDWRPGDQKVFISDIRKARQELQWTPKVGVRAGMERLYGWIKDNEILFV